MNNIFHFTFFICCLIVSSKCNENSEESASEASQQNPMNIVRANCAELTGDPDYFQKLLDIIEASQQCIKDQFEQRYEHTRDENQTFSKFFEQICETREEYYTCASIGLDAYSKCLIEEEKVVLARLRKVYRRIISQICEADIIKIIEFLSGAGLNCYQENLQNIGNTVAAFFHTKENPHLPSSYINEKTCGDLSKLNQDLKPVIDLCEDKSPGVFLENLITAIKDEISCETEALTNDN